MLHEIQDIHKQSRYFLGNYVKFEMCGHLEIWREIMIRYNTCSIIYKHNYIIRTMLLVITQKLLSHVIRCRILAFILHGHVYFYCTVTCTMHVLVYDPVLISETLAINSNIVIQVIHILATLRLIH